MIVTLEWPDAVRIPRTARIRPEARTWRETGTPSTDRSSEPDDETGEQTNAAARTPSSSLDLELKDDRSTARRPRAEPISLRGR
jgi:hypothetical protein